MDNSESLPVARANEANTTDAGERITISRSELEALRMKAQEPAQGSSPEPGREFDTSSPMSPHTLEGSRVSTSSVESILTRELAERDDKVASLERACKTAVRERELATALAGKPLVEGAVGQLIKLLRDDFEVYEENGGYTVTARDGRSVAQVVAEVLGSPEYSHFCLASSRGGTGARGGNRPHDMGVNAGRPKNLGEAIVMKWREDSAKQPESYLKPIGLRRHR
jgi:hypothetical protein